MQDDADTQGRIERVQHASRHDANRCRKPGGAPAGQRICEDKHHIHAGNDDDAEEKAGYPQLPR